MPMKLFPSRLIITTIETTHYRFIVLCNGRLESLFYRQCNKKIDEKDTIIEKRRHHVQEYRLNTEITKTRYFAASIIPIL